MRLKNSRGSSVTNVAIGAAIIVFVLFPVFSAVLERFAVLNKAQVIKDAVDVTNLATYNSIHAAALGKNTVAFDEDRTLKIYKELLAANLRLDSTLTPVEASPAEDAVTIESLEVYTAGFPLLCPNGVRIARPCVHSTVIVPIRPSLYRQVILNMLGKDRVELRVHVDSEIPIDN